MESMDAGISGRVFQINASNGGLPKIGQLQAEVTSLGLSNDRQQDAGVHGGPEQALCLFPMEHILSLQAEGQLVYPGALGENLTLVGLDWSRVEPGVRVRIGANVLIEVTKYTTPCSNLKPYFLDEDYSRVSQKRYPGWSRVYARVLQGGQIQVGDEVRILD